MKRIISFVVGIAVIVAIGFGIYKFFFDCQETRAEFGRIFVLENKMDYATLEDEAVVKLLDVVDDRCLEGEECVREGQFLVKLLVLNDMKMQYVTLGTLSESKKDLDKVKYSIELDGVDENGVALRLNRLEKKR
ncbi:MAG: hypothetical protein K2M17_02575 [Bacilli bacterium]|nr:hypothetical protein [Bacilli bacterium]